MSLDHEELAQDCDHSEIDCEKLAYSHLLEG